jgi:glutamine amidotransferase
MERLVVRENAVCRWVAYLGSPIAPKELLHDPERSLIEQSRRHAPNMALPNGDGTGLGWYDRRDEPALFRSIVPAWGDENLLELAAEIRSPLFLAHVRAGTGTPVQQTNCHPFRYRNWLFVHNGYVADYEVLRRELLLAVRPDLFTNIEGSTDSELLFHLALTFGLAEDPIAGLALMAGFVETAAAAAGVTDPALQMTVGVSDGTRLYAARYASGTEVNTLFVSEDVASLRMLYPENERFSHFSDGARAVVSEPLIDLPGMWREIPAGTALVIGDDIQERSFQPISPTSA